MCWRMNSKSPQRDWLGVGVLGVGPGGMIECPRWMSGERVDTKPACRGVVGPGDERAGDERAGEERNGSAMGGDTPTAD